MRLFQVTIPEHKAAEIYQLLHKELQIPQISRVHADNLFLFNFRVHNEKTNSLLGSLQKAGVGRHFGYIDILPIETSIPMTRLPEEKKKKSFFKKSYGVSERVTVEAIYSGIAQNNNLSFDFLTLLVVASIISAAGLATNNPVVVVASMLVSPLMGPILAFSLGGLINDWPMVAKGLLNEGIALFICVVIGFIVAFIFLPFGPQLGWPTNEMSSRGVPETLLYGLLVASPSGIGVALSLTSSSVTSLIGVAISASLLPPAVNTGMAFNYALFGPLLHNVNRVSLLIIAGISFSLCILNILCINVFAMIWFKLKKIAPITNVETDVFKSFQESDIHANYMSNLDTNPYEEADMIDDIMSDLDAADALP